MKYIKEYRHLFANEIYNAPLIIKDFSPKLVLNILKLMSFGYEMTPIFK